MAKTPQLSERHLLWLLAFVALFEIYSACGGNQLIDDHLGQFAFALVECGSGTCSEGQTCNDMSCVGCPADRPKTCGGNECRACCMDTDCNTPGTCQASAGTCTNRGCAYLAATDGTGCANECNRNAAGATCTGGVCNAPPGTWVRDGTPCTRADCVATCSSGTCMCAASGSQPDLGSSGGGHSGCSFGAVGGGGTAFGVGLVGLLFVFGRRRRIR